MDLGSDDLAKSCISPLDLHSCGPKTLLCKVLT
jgi:hypothetical protein